MKIMVMSLLFLLTSLLGCGVSHPATGTPIPVVLDVTGNWQIQSTTTSGSTSAGILLLGNLVGSGTNVTGTFRFSDLAPGNACGALNQVVSVSGTIDTSSPLAQVLNLTSSPINGSTITLQLTLPIELSGFANGTIAVKGATCTFASAPAFGALFLPVNGTFAGTLSPTAGSTSPSGTATLTVAQATAPSADGQYAITETLQFAAPGCNASAALTGTASGVGVSASNQPSSTSLVNLFATRGPGLAQSLSGNLLIVSPTCISAAGTQYTGLLNKQ